MYSYIEIRLQTYTDSNHKFSTKKKRRGKSWGWANNTNLACVSMNLAPLAATTISQASAISNPAVTANPPMAPIMGLRARSIWATGSDSKSFTSPLKTSSADVKSTPEQKARPDPDRIMTRTESSRSRDLNAWAMSVIIDLVNEFSDFGRFIVTYAIPFGSRFTSISFSDSYRSIFIFLGVSKWYGDDHWWGWDFGFGFLFFLGLMWFVIGMRVGLSTTTKTLSSIFVVHL